MSKKNTPQKVFVLKKSTFEKGNNGNYELSQSLEELHVGLLRQKACKNTPK